MLKGILPECLPEFAKRVTQDPLSSKVGYIADLQYNTSLTWAYLSGT